MVFSLDSAIKKRLSISAEELSIFCQNWKINELALFGSVLRSDFRDDSDIDVLISFDADTSWSLLDWVTMTEQLRLYRRLMTYQIQQFAPLAERVVVPVVPGNHDEVQRVGRVQRRYDDSWAIEGAVAVADAFAMADGFDHVSFVFPARDELTITLDVSGTSCGFAHGHQFGRDPIKWWSGQAHGMQAIGSATLLFGAHLHHLRVEQTGTKTFVQIPALDGGSTWWRQESVGMCRWLALHQDCLCQA